MGTVPAKKTWVVLVQGQNASVYERAVASAELTRLHEFEVAPSAPNPLRALASWLDAARRARAFERLMLIAPQNDSDQLISDLSRPTRALIATPQSEILRGLAEETTP